MKKGWGWGSRVGCVSWSDSPKNAEASSVLREASKIRERAIGMQAAARQNQLGGEELRSPSFGIQGIDAVFDYITHLAQRWLAPVAGPASAPPRWLVSTRPKCMQAPIWALSALWPPIRPPREFARVSRQGSVGRPTHAGASNTLLLPKSRTQSSAPAAPSTSIHPLSPSSITLSISLLLLSRILPLPRPSSTFSPQSTQLVAPLRPILHHHPPQPPAKTATMSVVTLLGVEVLNNPAKFGDKYQFEITFECLEPLEKGSNIPAPHTASRRRLPASPLRRPPADTSPLQISSGS